MGVKSMQFPSSVSRNKVHHAELNGHGRVEILLESVAQSHELWGEERILEVHRNAEPRGQAEQ